MAVFGVCLESDNRGRMVEQSSAGMFEERRCVLWPHACEMCFMAACALFLCVVHPPLFCVLRTLLVPQFFITYKAHAHLNGKYTVFGHVSE